MDDSCDDVMTGILDLLPWRRSPSDWNSASVAGRATSCFLPIQVLYAALGNWGVLRSLPPILLHTIKSIKESSQQVMHLVQ